MPNDAARGYRCATAADMAGLPVPIGAEPVSVPADHGLQLYDDDRVMQRRVQSIQPHISKRSMFHSLVREANLRRRITSCWRKTRFSASSHARLVNRDRIAISSWVRNATIGRFLPYAQQRVIPD